MGSATESGVAVHLIDGTFELFRSFFGAPPATGADGREVGACRGLMRSFYALLQRSEVSHVACAFDHVIESFRNDLFDGYKTGEGIDPALYGQFGLAEQVCQALGIVTWPMVEFEADDAIATACERLRRLPEVSTVVICSPDKDLGQCALDDKVVLWDRIRDKRIDRNGVLEKFGVLPESIPDYLALVGDSADGIPGIPRWGAKGAATVLHRYQHLEDIPLDEKAWDIKVRGAGTLVKNLAAGLQDALLFRRLATLRCDVPLAEGLAELRYRGVSLPALRAVCEELGDPAFAERVDNDVQAGNIPSTGAGQ